MSAVEPRQEPPRNRRSRPDRTREDPVRRSTSFRIATAAVAAMGAAAMSPGWASGAARFGAPVRVTPANGGGYEPGIYSDAEGDLFMTAHKENAELALSPDSRSATGTRSM